MNYEVWITNFLQASDWLHSRFTEISALKYMQIKAERV